MGGEKIIGKKDSSDLLLSKLNEIQQKEGVITEETIKRLCEETGIHATKIYEVATFYSFLDTKQKGKHIIRVCNSPSCNVNGSVDILKILEEELGIKVGETSSDGKFTLEKTACIGCCDEAPACLMDGKAYTFLSQEKIKEMIENADS